MKIGITYDLKADVPAGADLPDDFQEEFDSPATIEAIAAVLRGLGHEVEALGDGRELLERLLRDPPDFVFNFAEGHGIGRCREARVPAVLEMLGIPYTGSDPLTLAVTLDKDCAKRLVQSAGVPVPRWTVLEPDHDPTALPRLPYTAIVKPAWEGSSKGIRGKCVVDRVDELVEAVTTLRRDHRQPILVEEYIAGEELTVGIVGNDPPRIIGVLRVVPQRPTSVSSTAWRSSATGEDRSATSVCPAAGVRGGGGGRSAGVPDPGLPRRGAHRLPPAPTACRTSSKSIRCRASTRSRATWSSCRGWRAGATND